MAYRKEVIEKMILDASEKFLFRYGYKNLNLNNIAKEINISKTTLYKIFDSKYVVANRVIERLLQNSEAEMSELLQAELPLPKKLSQGIEIISKIYTKMDMEFLRDLENSLPELWERIDTAREEKEELLTALLLKEQKNGTVRNDIDASLLSAAVLTLVRGMYNPTFFLTHQVTTDLVNKVIVDILLQGTLKTNIFNRKDM